MSGLRFSFFLFFVTAYFTFASAQLKVVSLSPIASKSLILLGAEDLVVGCTKWCPYASEKIVVANAIDVNVEQVLGVHPDVIFASTLTSDESLSTLLSLGLNVIVLPRMTDFDSMCEELILIGQSIGMEAQAQSEVLTAKARLEEVRLRIPQGKAPKVMFQVGAKPIFVAMPNTFINDYIVQSGGVNIYSDLLHGTVTRESVLMRNPEAIFISTMPTSAIDVKHDWESYSDLSACQLGQIVLVDQEMASSPTIHTFVDVVELMINVLYAKAVKE